MSIFDELRKGIPTRLPEEMEALGAELANALPDNCLVALHGDLGSGKTTFVKGLARGLGVTHTVTSPTFNIFSLYQGTRQLLHMDAYRLHEPSDLDALCIDEFIQPPFIIAIEWPENVDPFMEHLPRFDLEFAIDPDHRHRLMLF